MTDQPDPQRIETVTFHSQALARTMRYCVVLPEGYHASRHTWPTLLLLHGRGRDARSLIDAPHSYAALLSAPFVTLLPDGDDSWYINSPVKLEDRYEDHIEQVMHDAQGRYRLSRQRTHRGIAGWSMGGYGAARFAQQHASEFSALATIIALLDFPREGLPEGQSYRVPVRRFSSDPAIWARLNPIHAAEQLRGMHLLIIAADRGFDRMMNDNFHHHLQQLGIAHEYDMLEGAHTFPVVQRAIPRVIEFMDHALTGHAEK